MWKSVQLAFSGFFSTEGPAILCTFELDELQGNGEFFKLQYDHGRILFSRFYRGSNTDNWQDSSLDRVHVDCCGEVDISESCDPQNFMLRSL